MPKQKVDVRLIDNKAARLVTFSKRRKSLFKKARELSTLCHAEVGVVVVSEAQRVTHEASPTSIYEIFGKLDIQDQPQRVNQPLENQLDEENKRFSTELEEFHVKIRKGLENLSIEKLLFLKNFIEKMATLLKKKEIHLKEDEGETKQLGVEMLTTSIVVPNGLRENALDLNLRDEGETKQLGVEMLTTSIVVPNGLRENALDLNLRLGRG